MPATIEEVLVRAQHLGFLGPTPIEEHLSHADAFGAAIGRAWGASQPEGRAVDLGSGGGVPGLVLALVYPGLTWSLVEGSERRAAFLDDAVADLALASRVEVLADRAENVGRSPAYRAAADLVVARSFGPSPVLAECAAPLLRVGGALIVSEPPGSPVAERWVGAVGIGLGPADHHPGPPAFVVLRQVSVCPDRYPRRVGIPAKRPLW